MLIDLKCTVEKSTHEGEEHVWVAHCLPLDLVHCADRLDDAFEGLKQLIEIQLDSMKWETLKSMAAQHGESVEAVEEKHRAELRGVGWILSKDTAQAQDVKESAD